MKALLARLAILATMFAAAPASADQLAPFKDDLFAYPATLSTSDDGALMTVDYREMRDINGRDAIPERKAKPEYVALGVRSAQRELRVETEAGDVRVVAVGREKGASMIVLYIHGKGGTRRQGADDFTFGGNFNRLKNLVNEAGGLYLSPDFSDFEERGAREIAALIRHFASASPEAAVFVACGSMGGAICYRLADDKTIGTKLGGLLLLGSFWDESFLDSVAFRLGIPIFFAQGSRDPVFPLERQVAFFRAIRAKEPGYDARFVVFESGSHGTPIRMTDWRDTLNWMMRIRP